MDTTSLKLVLTAQDMSEVPHTPATGLITKMGPSASLDFGGLGSTILLIICVVLVALVVIVLVKSKKSRKNFGLTSKWSVAFFKSFIWVTMIGLFGHICAVIYIQNNSANATAADVEIKSSDTVTVNGKIDAKKNKIFCGTDVVKITQATPAGYTLYMHVPEGKLVLQSDDTEAEFVSMEDKLSSGTWGYATIAHAMDASGNQDYSDILTAIPTEPTSIRSVTNATEANDATVVVFCASVSPNTKAGTYQSNIEYTAVANTVNYTLNYDANGGMFETEPTVQESGAIQESSYDFTVTDVQPISPAGTSLNFYGWSITGDSLSDVYLAGDTITVTEPETTLKAVWGYARHEVTYIKNTTEEVINFIPKQYCIVTRESGSSCDINITNRVPTRRGYTLLGWSESAYTPSTSDSLSYAREKVEYIPGEHLTLNDDISLYAVWWKVSENDFQAELRWGEHPVDIDSHLQAIRNSDNASVMHVYFDHQNAIFEDDETKLRASLDVDDRNGYGPEILTLDAEPDDVYNDYTFYYYIHNFSWNDTSRDSVQQKDRTVTLKESGAKIQLLSMDGQSIDIEVSNALGSGEGEEGLYWNIFAIKDGKIIERNTLTKNPELDY